jgi:hypothetical protein
MFNVTLSLRDEKRLKKAGTNADRSNGMACLVRVYLFQRAKVLKHNLINTTTCIVCFVLVITASQG